MLIHAIKLLIQIFLKNIINLKEKALVFVRINTKISNKNLIIKEVPIKYFSRTKQMGKKISYIDAFYAIKL